MAEHDVVSGTLTPNEVEYVTVNVAEFGPQSMIGIVNRSQDGVIWVRTDGVDPEVAGFDCYPVLSYRSFDSPEGANEVTIGLISDMEINFTVEGGHLQ